MPDGVYYSCQRCGSYHCPASAVQWTHCERLALAKYTLEPDVCPGAVDHRIYLLSDNAEKTDTDHGEADPRFSTGDEQEDEPERREVHCHFERQPEDVRRNRSSKDLQLYHKNMHQIIPL